MLFLLAELDQSLKRVACLFNEVFKALRHIIGIKGACYSAKLHRVRLQQVDQSIVEGFISAVFAGAAKLVYFEPIVVQ